MVFIVLLIISAFSIASSAAFFSVYGLANTFSGTFWGVIVMGASLEAGKLMGASYLYRYWNNTHIALRAVLLSVILGVMLLTSGGIFGFLSTGYQSDILPLKQKAAQVKMLNDEQDRLRARKVQIDDLLAKNVTTVTTVQKADGSIDKNATAALRAAQRSQESLSRQYKDEQKQATTRINEIDVLILPLKQELIKTEAHTGPIIYIARALGVESDDATKYLIYLIIFVFDPMAIALTLAVNVALRVRREEKEAAKKVLTPVVEPVVSQTPIDDISGPEQYVINNPIEPVPDIVEPTPEPEVVAPQPIYTPSKFEISPPITASVPLPSTEPPIHWSPVTHTVPEPNTPEITTFDFGKAIRGPVVKADGTLNKELLDKVKATSPPEPIVVNPMVDAPPVRLFSPSAWASGNIDAAKLSELVDHYQHLKTRRATAPTLMTKDELWELRSIADILQKRGLSMYL